MAEGAAGAPRSRPQGRGTLQKFPELIAAIARDHSEAERLEVWFLNEARVGQTGRVCRRWFERGRRPRGVRDLRHEAVYLFGAVCSQRNAGVALVLPTVSAAAMQVMLDELAQAVSPGAHAVVLMDRAGWHVARELDLPANLTPLFLPPQFPRIQRDRSGLAVPARTLPLPASLAELRRHPRRLLRAWNVLLAETGRIRSLRTLDWATPVSS